MSKLICYTCVNEVKSLIKKKKSGERYGKNSDHRFGFEFGAAGIGQYTRRRIDRKSVV